MLFMGIERIISRGTNQVKKLALVFTILGSMHGYSAGHEGEAIRPDIPGIYAHSENYGFDDLGHALGKLKLKEVLDYTKSKGLDLKGKWDSTSLEERQRVYELFHQPLAFAENRLNKDEKQRYEQFREAFYKRQKETFSAFRKPNQPNSELFSEGYDLNSIQKEYDLKSFGLIDFRKFLGPQELLYVFVSEQGKSRLNPSFLNSGNIK